MNQMKTNFVKLLASLIFGLLFAAQLASAKQVPSNSFRGHYNGSITEYMPDIRIKGTEYTVRTATTGIQVKLAQGIVDSSMEILKLLRSTAVGVCKDYSFSAVDNMNKEIEMLGSNNALISYTGVIVCFETK